MLTHLLDTSAWLAHILDEPEGNEITALFEDSETEIGLSVLSILEVNAVFRRKNRSAEFNEMLEYYTLLFDRLIPSDEAVVRQAIVLREATPARLPAMDSLIAATAAHHEAILVHRDPHFLAIPDKSLKQNLLKS